MQAIVWRATALTKGIGGGKVSGGLPRPDAAEGEDMRKTVIGLLGAVVLLSMVPAAHAAFPGLNGKIAYYTQQGTSDDIWVMEPNGSGNMEITDDTQHE